MPNKRLLAAATLPFLAVPALAHVTLTEPAAKANSDFVAAFRVGHGCGASPTVALKIEIPPGIMSARPRAKAGWTIEQQTEPGKTRIASITWRGGSLAADEFDEFEMLLKLPDTPGILVFPATQTCASTTEHWSDPPVPGRSSAHPAPVLTVTPASDAGESTPGMVMPDGSRM